MSKEIRKDDDWLDEEALYEKYERYPNDDLPELTNSEMEEVFSLKAKKLEGWEYYREIAGLFIAHKAISTLLTIGKKPVSNWKTYLEHGSTLADIRMDAMEHSKEITGVGAVLGHVSGNLVDIDADTTDEKRINAVISVIDSIVPNCTSYYVGGKGVHCLLKIKEDVAKHDGKIIEWKDNEHVELRAVGQSILPGSKHPSGKTYRWTDEETQRLFTEGRELPLIPTISVDDFTLLQTRLAALGDSKPIEIKSADIADVIPTKSKYRYSTADVITEFNSKNSVEDMLIELGYTQASHDMFCHPTDTNKEGSAHLLDGGDIVFLFGKNDPLAGQGGGSNGNTFDAFGLYTASRFNGDRKSAIKTTSNLYGMGEIKSEAVSSGPVKSKAADAADYVSDLIPLDGVDITSVEWLWLDRIPLGNLSMIFGDGGCGKSHITLDLVAASSTGRNFPDGTPSNIGESIIITAEDNLGDTIAPRLIAHGADLKKVFSLPMVTYLDENGEPYKKCFSLGDIPKLEEELKRRPNVNLVIIDPISAFLDGRDSHKDSDIRQLLTPLKQLAENNNLAVVMVAHINKTKGLKAIQKLSGSAGFNNSCRSSFFVQSHPNGEGRIMSHVKHNLSDCQDTLGYDIEEKEVKGSKGESVKTSSIIWTGVVNITADEALAAADETEYKSGKAEDYIAEVMKDGKTYNVKDIQDEMMNKGIGYRTVQRAMNNVENLKRMKQGFGKNSRWVCWLDSEDENESKIENKNDITWENE